MANGEVEDNHDRGPVAETRDAIRVLRRGASNLKITLDRDPSATNMMREMAEQAVALSVWLQHLHGQLHRDNITLPPPAKLVEVEALEKATEENRDAPERLGQEPPRDSRPTTGTTPS